jgi:hypothetical protein
VTSPARSANPRGLEEAALRLVEVAVEQEAEAQVELGSGHLERLAHLLGGRQPCAPVPKGLVRDHVPVPLGRHEQQVAEEVAAL